jgi:hypothetical protein
LRTPGVEMMGRSNWGRGKCHARKWWILWRQFLPAASWGNPQNSAVEGRGFCPNLSTLPSICPSSSSFIVRIRFFGLPKVFGLQSKSVCLCVCMCVVPRKGMDSIKFPPDSPLPSPSLHSIPPFPSSNFNLPSPVPTPFACDFPRLGRGRTTFHIVISFSSSSSCCYCSWKGYGESPTKCVCINWESWGN